MAFLQMAFLQMPPSDAPHGAKRSAGRCYRAGCAGRMARLHRPLPTGHARAHSVAQDLDAAGRTTPRHCLGLGSSSHTPGHGLSPATGDDRPATTGPALPALGKRPGPLRPASPLRWLGWASAGRASAATRPADPRDGQRTGLGPAQTGRRCDLQRDAGDAGDATDSGI
jgi:hypothetical protein